MNARTGDFLRAASVALETRSLEQKLALEGRVRHLYDELAKDKTAYQHLKPLKDQTALLHDLLNVMLRYDQPAKWRDFAAAIKRRKASHEGVGARFEQLRKWFASLVEAGASGDYPLQQILATGRNSIEAMLEEKSMTDAERQQWDEFIAEMEAALRPAALREWLCLSIRRILDERNIRKPGSAAGH